MILDVTEEIVCPATCLIISRKESRDATGEFSRHPFLAAKHTSYGGLLDSVGSLTVLRSSYSLFDNNGIERKIQWQ